MRPELVHAAQVAWSPDGRLTSAEGATTQVFGAPPEALVGRTLAEVLGISAERAAELQQRAQASGSAPTVEFITRKEPATASFRLVLSATPGGESYAGVMEMGELLKGAPPLQISALSSSLSHEIRNPLSSVKMAVQTLQRNTGLSERDHRRLSIANREIRTMERMLGLLSEYGREVPLSLELTPLRQLVQEAAALIGPELTERKTQLEIDEPAAEPPPAARVDALRLRLVLAQLLLNVAMGHPEGGTVQVRLRSGPSGGGGVLELLDPQAALPEEERDTLFVPFGSRLARGAGLSLAALRHAMKAHGGDVTAEGSSAPGTRFTLSFPA